MDLYSNKATRLRVEVDPARAEVQVAKKQIDSARQIITDGISFNPYGLFAQDIAVREYASAMEKYRVALKAWADHVFDS